VSGSKCEKKRTVKASFVCWLLCHSQRSGLVEGKKEGRAQKSNNRTCFLWETYMLRVSVITMSRSHCWEVENMCWQHQNGSKSCSSKRWGGGGGTKPGQLETQPRVSPEKKGLGFFRYWRYVLAYVAVLIGLLSMPVYSLTGQGTGASMSFLSINKHWHTLI